MRRSVPSSVRGGGCSAAITWPWLLGCALEGAGDQGVVLGHESAGDGVVALGLGVFGRGQGGRPSSFGRA